MNVPAEQLVVLVHVFAPVALWNSPAGQASQASAFAAAEKVPAEHSPHVRSDAFVSGAMVCVPAAHVVACRQLRAAAPAWKCSLPHSSHVALFGSAWKRPGWQIPQLRSAFVEAPFREAEAPRTLEAEAVERANACCCPGPLDHQ